jgi:ATP phosphoribosyltransferase
VLKIALPNKGRLFEEVKGTLADAGLAVQASSDRALTASLGGEFMALFVRAEDIPEFVADGAAHAGITGWDCVCESGRELESLLDLGFGRCHLAVAARAVSSVDAIPDGAAVATSFPRLTERFFRDLGKKVHIAVVSGACEVAPHLGIADVIVDLVSTGSTLKVNGLVELATVVESSARLVSLPKSKLARDVEKTLADLSLALESVVRARGQRYLMANAPRARLAEVEAILPGISGATVVDLADEKFVAVHAVVPEKSVYRTIGALKGLGCEGILITRIERLTP